LSSRTWSTDARERLSFWRSQQGPRFADSPLEESGFELMVPPRTERKWEGAGTHQHHLARHLSLRLRPAVMIAAEIALFRSFISIPSQVGPRVRIRLAPAASQERTGPPRCEDGGFSPVTLRCSTREIVNAPSARAVASSRPCAIAAWAWRIAAAAQMGEAGVPRWRRKAACRRPRRSGRRSARPRCCHGSAASSVQSELDCRLLVLEASPDEAPPEDLRKFVEPLACDLLVVR
jgi:hypothetical protein